MEQFLSLRDRLVIARLPGSAWTLLLSVYLDWVLETDVADIIATDRPRIGRQLLVLYEAAAAGAPPTFDGELTALNELVRTACEKLEFEVGDSDREFAAGQIVIVDA